MNFFDVRFVGGGGLVVLFWLVEWVGVVMLLRPVCGEVSFTGVVLLVAFVVVLFTSVKKKASVRINNLFPLDTVNH